VTVGVDVSAEAEAMGLDMYQTGERAYDELLASVLDIGQDQLNQEFISAAFDGNIEQMKKLINEGADVDFTDYDGRSAVHVAASAGRTKVLKFLYDRYKVDLNAEDKKKNTPLNDAIEHNKSGTVKYLEGIGAITGDHSNYLDDDNFLEEVKKGNIEVVKFWLSKKGKSRNLEDHDVHTCDYDCRTALHIAAGEGNIAMVELLLKAGADPLKQDRWGQTPSDCARKNKHRRTVIVINRVAAKAAPVAKIASVDSKTAEAAGSGADGPVDDSASIRIQMQPLTRPVKHNSAAKKHFKAAIDNVVMSTHKSKAHEHGKHTTHAMSQQTRALLNAAQSGKVKTVALLLEKGVKVSSSAEDNGLDLECSDYDFRTPLHLAVTGGYLDVVKVLIKYKCNVNVYDRFGHTPLRDALDHKQQSGDIYDKIVSVLRARGATRTDEVLAFKLCWAAAKGDLEKIKRIESEGGSLKAHDYDGRTAMHLAASEGKLHVLEYLVGMHIPGCPPMAHTDKFGATPLDDAVREGHKECEAFLRKSSVGPEVVLDPATKKAQ